MYKKFNEVPISSIKPEGWLKKYLMNQKDGLTGHLEEAGFPFDFPAASWAPPEGMESNNENWCPYEQKGYWVDGMIRCGHLLEDKFLIEKALVDINYVLEHADEDGYLGPRFLKNQEEYTEFMGFKRWVHAVFFRAFMAHYSATGDERVIEALKKHYLTNTSPHSNVRDVCNVEVILWTYEKTGDKRLLEHAVNAFEEYNRLSAGGASTMESFLSESIIDEHGVTYNEIGKLGAILYMYTGNEMYLESSINAYQKTDKYHMLIDGVHSSSERLRGKDPLDSHETCDIADYTWSLGYMLMATGNVEYADKIERACFNAAPGAVTSDFRALQYFSCPNQVIADKNSNHNAFFKGKQWMSYRPNPGTECCPGDVNRIMPNYVSRMWMNDSSGGLAAVLYGPGSIAFPAGKESNKVTIVEETDYPFSDSIDFLIHTDMPVSFPLSLRIPCWCSGTRIKINGKPLEAVLEPGTFTKIERRFSQGDRITLVLPMKFKMSHWPEGGIGIERGPLVYSLKIEEDWQVDRDEPKSSEEFPAWNLYAASPWNYALELDEEGLESGIEIINKTVSEQPWTINNAPVELKVPARRVNGWELAEDDEVFCKTFEDDAAKISDSFKMHKMSGKFRFTPPLPDSATLSKRLSGVKETVTLVPYGCTKLRITIFPQCKG